MEEDAAQASPIPVLIHYEYSVDLQSLYQVSSWGLSTADSDPDVDSNPPISTRLGFSAASLRRYWGAVKTLTSDAKGYWPPFPTPLSLDVRFLKTLTGKKRGLGRRCGAGTRASSYTRPSFAIVLRPQSGGEESGPGRRDVDNERANDIAHQTDTVAPLRPNSSTTLRRLALLNPHLSPALSPLSTSAMPSPAPWRSPFEFHLTTNSSTSFTLSTIAFDAQNRPVPRARICEFRGFWPTPKLHPSAIEALNEQNVGLNPSVCVSDCLSATTDARMEKVEQLRASGGLVECVFWLADVKTQWRVRGTAHIIGDLEGGAEENEARKKVLENSEFRGDAKGWDVERQVTAYFANHSPVMRGSFKNPSPGQPKAGAEQDEESELGQKVNQLDDPAARANFRVMVIAPDEVESLNVETRERKKWTLEGGVQSQKKWKEVDLWP
ncbi:uncharacterized protein KD926_011373 [Aspergillus affinis]|uniref:uncharacterized protein n=1 Tax=Aspergillus affinis TaxID=1070780 RepID=UPI0022FED76F|nr:uncharacterized protein KD926_011373 [Aspergillus affinis]KAI9038035.1 hypothetical protein KD926_011373 [Aspergillus affinis]